MREEIYQVLNSALTAPVGWGSVAAGKEPPFAVLHLLSRVSDRRNEGRGLFRARVQVDCYGASLDAADLLGAEVFAVLDGFQSEKIDGVFHVAERDNRDDGPETLFRISQDFAVIYRE